MISFLGNFQTNNFNEIFQFFILLCSTLCGSLKAYMVVNFRVRKNSQGSHKLPEHVNNNNKKKLQYLPKRPLYQIIYAGWFLTHRFHISKILSRTTLYI
jgi:hypothetical protein